MFWHRHLISETPITTKHNHRFVDLTRHRVQLKWCTSTTFLCYFKSLIIETIIYNIIKHCKIIINIHIGMRCNNFHSTWIHILFKTINDHKIFFENVRIYYAISLRIYRKIVKLFEIVKLTCVGGIQTHSNQ